MSTYTEITYQLVFGAKYHTKFLSEKMEDELFRSISRAIINMDCFPI
jgi:hypothetical protein